MALWGNKDSKSATGTVSIADTGVVTGTSTLFTTEAKVGNFIKAGGVDYQIVSITSDTVAKVIMGANNGNGTVTTASSASYTLSEKPAFVAHEGADSGYGKTGDSNKVFGVDTTEAEFAGKVVNLQIANGGSGYSEAPALTFAAAPNGGTTATGTATISGGKVTGVTITGAGAGYTSVPAVTIQVPVLTTPTSAITTATDKIAYTAHGQTAGSALTYKNGGGAAATGLTDGTVYYVATAGLTANAFELKTSTASGTLTPGVITTGTAGQFTCGASTLAVGDRVTITGTLSGSGTISGYTSGTTYKVSAVTGVSPTVSGFTLTTEAGGALTTTAGTLLGLTYTTETVVDISGTGNNSQYFLINAGSGATATATLSSGTGGSTAIAHSGWVRRTVGTGGRAGRVFYETLVANGTSAATAGDQADDAVLPEA
jgi:hypothetical protein